MKPVTFRGRLHQVPALVVHFHLDEHIAGKNFRSEMLFWPFHLDHFLDRNENLAEHVFHALRAIRSISAPLHDFSSPNRREPHTIACSYPPPPQNQVVKHPLEGLVGEPEKKAMHTMKTKHDAGRLGVSLAARARPPSFGFHDGLADETRELLTRAENQATTPLRSDPRAREHAQTNACSESR